MLKILHSFSRRRSGFAVGKAMVGLAGTGVVTVVWFLLSGTHDGEALPKVLTETVVRKDFRLEIIEPGEIESAFNVEVRCEVKSRNSAGTNILEIVPEGTPVEKDDFLVRLDDSALQKDLLQQRIEVHQAKATLVQAEADVEAAKLALIEYESGSYRQDEEQLESAEFVARENLRRAEEFLSYSKKLSVKGYISQVQLAADAFAVKKALKELDLAQTKLEVLRTHARKAKVNDLNASILTTEARLLSRKNSYELESKKESEIEEQIEKCVIFAPGPGEVTYANRNSISSSSSSSNGILIEEGRPVRERQVIIRLPDPTRMRVIAKVNENQVELVKPRMPVSITIDAFRDLNLKGSVEKISEYPLPSASRYTAHIKEYASEILIEDPPEGLRPGMTAKVHILVKELPNALQVPVYAILRVEGASYCLVADETEVLTVRPVLLGPVNASTAVVTQGLKEGESIVVNAAEFRENLTFPKLPSNRSNDTGRGGSVAPY